MLNKEINIRMLSGRYCRDDLLFMKQISSILYSVVHFIQSVKDFNNLNKMNRKGNLKYQEIHYFTENKYFFYE